MVIYSFYNTYYFYRIAAVARAILVDGDGSSPKGFKCEWATVKDGMVFLGSTGKEWSDGPVVINNNPQWVKV